MKKVKNKNFNKIMKLYWKCSSISIQLLYFRRICHMFGVSTKSVDSMMQYNLDLFQKALKNEKN